MSIPENSAVKASKNICIKQKTSLTYGLKDTKITSEKLKRRQLVAELVRE